jgi:diguanylate cyclase (GGDEF)-like protein/PAS domain S-box-containing protein
MRELSEPGHEPEWFAQAEGGVGEFRDLASASADVCTVSAADGSYVYASGACWRLFGWLPDELLGHNLGEFMHPDDFPAERATAASAEPGDSFTTTHRFRCADGSYRWTEATTRRIEAWGSEFVVATMRDITERQKADERVQRLALTDPLTGLANRAVLMDRLRGALRRQSRSTGVVAVLYLDLDRFKVINDSLGHRVGDEVLRSVAKRLVRFVRGADTLSRLGGDEFVIVAEGVSDERMALELADRVTNAGREPFMVGGEEVICTWSLGVATTADSNHSADELLQEADLALYRAKERGRDRTEVFDEDLRTTAVGRLSTERMLRGAIDEGRVFVEYQPIVDLADAHVITVEALVRITDQDHGRREPDSFLEVAEETGLLVAMDEMVMSDAVERAAAWYAEFGDASFSGVGLNVTSRRLADAGFAREVVGALDAEGLPHHLLQVEITERVLMEASNSTMTGLRSLKDAGIPVGLDDFGTGFSSLAYLRQFPLDFVKIDRSFIHGLTFVPGDDAVVAAVIDLSHALGLLTIAEGVETLRQLDTLRSLGCDRAQGFLLGRPTDPETVSALLRSGEPLTGS